ncbi:MAG: hypothetical protein ABI151_02085 [Chitinophagaceae bacterium]
MTKVFLQFISIQLEPICYIILSLALLLRLRIKGQRKIRVLLGYYLLSAAGLSYASWLVFDNLNSGASNNWIYNLLILPAMLAIGYYFHQTFTGKISRHLSMALVAVNLIYSGLRNLTYTRIIIFDSVGYSLLSISVSMLCFAYFYQLLRNVNENKLWADFDFWIVSSMLLYFLGGFFIFLFYNILDSNTYEERELLSILWSVHNVLLFLSSLIMLYGCIWINYRNRS